MNLIVVKRFITDSVKGGGGGVPCLWRMGKYVCREQPKIFQQRVHCARKLVCLAYNSLSGVTGIFL